MKSISVFCGSKTGNDPIYKDIAYQLGETLALKNFTLIYGGAKVGLMGKLADGALENNGEVIGVLPQFLKNKEILHDKLTQLILVETMHERKIKMHELSDAVIVLPGGYGTMDEFFEMITWSQLQLHTKPIALLNINGYYENIIKHADKMMQEGFLSPKHRKMILLYENVNDMLTSIKNADVKNWS
jgi:uncharacterized protein (TIGR00730 family)